MLPLMDIGTVTVSTYRLCALIGALVAVLIAMPRLKRAGLSWRRSLGMLIGMCIAFLIGARLWNVAVNPACYQNRNWYEWKFRGFSMYGGLLGALLVIIVFSFGDHRIWRVLDAMTLPAGMAFSIARVGCFLNGCCCGHPTASFLGMVFPSTDNIAPLGFALNFPVWPTQLFELAGALLGLPVVFHAARKFKWPEGCTFLAYAAWFSLMRLLILPLRSLPYPKVVTRYIYPIIYIGLALAGIFLLRKKIKRVS